MGKASGCPGSVPLGCRGGGWDPGFLVFLDALSPFNPAVLKPNLWRRQRTRIPEIDPLSSLESRFLGGGGFCPLYLRRGRSRVSPVARVARMEKEEERRERGRAWTPEQEWGGSGHMP